MELQGSRKTESLADAGKRPKKPRLFSLFSARGTMLRNFFVRSREDPTSLADLLEPLLGRRQSFSDFVKATGHNF